MLNVSYAGCFGLPLLISAQFTLEMCAAAENLKKISKAFLKIQGYLRSSMLTPLKSLSFVFVMLSKKSAAMFTLDRPRRQN